jgi:hypothetical protein
MDKFMLMEKIRAKLRVDRAPYQQHWYDIQELLDPHLVIWDMSTTGFPDFVQDVLMSSKPLQSFDDLVAGLQEGIVPASQMWSRYGLQDDESPLNDDEVVWNYFHTISKTAMGILHRSNFYQQTPSLFRSVSRYMTGAMIMERDTDSYVRFTTFPIGSYYVSNNDKGLVDTFCREFRMKVRQVVEKFCEKENGKYDLSNLSDAVRNMWLDPAKREEWVQVIHLVFPNPEYDKSKSKLNAKYKYYSSNYYELTQNVGGSILQEEGYDFFPIYCVRWWRQFTDAYGVDGPGFKAIGDIRQLYKQIQMYLSAMAKVNEPPLAADPSIAGVVGGQVGTTPGFMTIVPGGSKGGGFGPAYQIQPDLAAIKAGIDDLKKDIDRLCMADIFRMLSNDERQTPPTATEVLQKLQEVSHVIGPIFGNFDHDWIQPMMRDLYWMMLQDGLIPPAPEQLHGAPLKVEVISRIAMTLKMTEITGYQKGIEFATALAQAKQAGNDSLNDDEFLQRVFKALNLPPTTLFSKQQLQTIRQARQQAQDKQQAIENAHKLSGATKNLGQSDTGDNGNLLQQLMEQLKGQGAA